jgi:Sulfotransferase domain
MTTQRVLYRSWLSDNRRWDALQLREGDIVISAPSKCGVTWTQRLVSLLVFDGPDLPGPLSTVSPWIDATVRPVDEVVAALDGQRHRRFLKTHTPLDGLALDDRVTYIGVGRDPRDAAMSELFAWDNLDLDRVRALQQGAAPVAPPPDHPPPGGDPSPLEAFRHWMEGPILPPDEAGPGAFRPPDEAWPGAFRPPDRLGFRPPEGAGFRPPAKHMGSLANVLHHFGSVWSHRRLPNVAMFHYTDYQLDLPGELARLGRVLGYDVTPERAEGLARHASLRAMRARAAELAPESADGIWRDTERFFRAGGRGEWREFFDEFVARRYYDRINQLAPPDLLAWAHEGRGGAEPG